MADRLGSDRLASPDIHLHRVMLSKHRRGPWSSAEDSYLLDLVRTQGASNWVRISQMIGTRSPKQCRERFHQNLKPSLNLDPITPEEGILIERMVAEMGKRWAEIARRLHGRSDNAVKNWWNGGMNRRKRLDNRRAEVPSRPQQHYQQSSYDHYPAQHPSSYPSHLHAYPPPQGPSAHAHHLNTSSAAVSGRYEAPLPSPSAFSTVSRAESADGGAPPSMVSDASYSTFPHPATPPHSAGEQLPPLSLLDTRFSKPHHSHQRVSPPSSYSLPHSSSYAATSKTDYSSQAPRSYPLLTERWAEPASARSEPSPVSRTYNGPQLPLPSFNTIVSPRVGLDRSASPGSPLKDGRMDVSKLIH